MAVDTLTVRFDEDRAAHPLSYGQVNGASDTCGQRHGGNLAALAVHGQGAMSSFQSEGVDVGAGRGGESPGHDPVTR